MYNVYIKNGFTLIFFIHRYEMTIPVQTCCARTPTNWHINIKFNHLIWLEEFPTKNGKGVKLQIFFVLLYGIHTGVGRDRVPYHPLFWLHPIYEVDYSKVESNTYTPLSYSHCSFLYVLQKSLLSFQHWSIIDHSSLQRTCM